MPQLGTITKLQKTGHRAFMGGIFSDHKKVRVNYSNSGIIETCYDPDLSIEFGKMCKKYHMDENVRYTAAINYMMCRKSGLAAKTRRAGGITAHQNFTDAMTEVFDKYIVVGSEHEINISSKLRRYLTTNRGGLVSGQNIVKMYEARNECVSMLSGQMDYMLSNSIISSRLAKSLALQSSPTDLEVRKRLGLDSH